jgi:hypothetical protein
MNLDTNQIDHAVAIAQDIHSQVQTNWPAICAFAVVASRELRNFNLWCVSVAEWTMSHGGALMLLRKLFWNPAVK